MAPHLIVALSSHGFGHIGQIAPVIEELRSHIPDIRVTVRTAAPRFKLVERFGEAVSIAPIETDVGMVQHDAQRIAWEASGKAYADFHHNWNRRVDAEAQALYTARADAVLAAVPYLVLAGAERAGIPALALGSINWLDIYAHYFEALPEARELMEQMRHAYASARTFLKPAPSMPMPRLDNTHSIGPICQRGRANRPWFVERLGLREDERLVMVSLGGMDLRPPVEQWPTLPGVRLLVPASWHSAHPATVDFETLGIPYIDALWSCDALICKPGYGSLVEAACAGIPVLYLERPDWPEAPHLLRWLEGVGRSAPLTQARWTQGNLCELLDQTWREAVPPRIAPTGVPQAASAIAALLG